MCPLLQVPLSCGVNSVGEGEQRLLCQECFWLQVTERPTPSTLQAMGFLGVVISAVRLWALTTLRIFNWKGYTFSGFFQVAPKAGRGVRFSASVWALIYHQIHTGHLCCSPPTAPQGETPAHGRGNTDALWVVKSEESWLFLLQLFISWNACSPFLRNQAMSN